MHRQQQTYAAHRNVNPFVASQMDHTSAQRRQSGAGMDNFPCCLSLEEQHLYKPSEFEGQWKWDRDASKILNQTPSYSFNQGAVGQRDNGARPHYHGQTPNSFDNTANREIPCRLRSKTWKSAMGIVHHHHHHHQLLRVLKENSMVKLCNL